MPKVKFYAVKVGREGPKIYESWNDVRFSAGYLRLCQVLIVPTSVQS